MSKIALVHPNTTDHIVRTLIAASKELDITISTDYEKTFDYYLIGHHSTQFDKVALSNCTLQLPSTITSKAKLVDTLVKCELPVLDTLVINSVEDINTFPFENIFIKPIDSTFRCKDAGFAIYQSHTKNTLISLIDQHKEFFQRFKDTFVIQRNLSYKVDDAHRQVDQKGMFVLVNGNRDLLSCLYVNQSLTETNYEQVIDNISNEFIDTIEFKSLQGQSIFDYNDKVAVNLLNQTKAIVDYYKIKNCCLWVQGIEDPTTKELFLTDISYRIPSYYLVTFGPEYAKSLMKYMYDIGEPRSDADVTYDYFTLAESVISNIGFNQDIIDFGRHLTVVNDYNCFYPTASKRMNFKAIGISPEDCKERMRIFKEFVFNINKKENHE